jgi:hypothetical protein
LGITKLKHECLNLLKQYHAAVDAKTIQLNTHQEHILRILETCYRRPTFLRFPWQKNCGGAGASIPNL